MAPYKDWAPLLDKGLCGNEYMKWQKTLLLQTSAECTGSTLSSKFVRSRYQVYSPYNDTEDVDRLNKFVDEEPGTAGVTQGRRRLLTSPTCCLLTRCMLTCYIGKSFVEKMAEVLANAKDEVGSTKPTHHLPQHAHAASYMHMQMLQLPTVVLLTLAASYCVYCLLLTIFYYLELVPTCSVLTLLTTYCLLPSTGYQVSATKSSDAQLKTSGKAINMWWVASWGGYPETPSDLIMAAYSMVLVFIIILLNTSSLLLGFAGLIGILAAYPLAMFLWLLCGQVRSESIYSPSPTCLLLDTPSTQKRPTY